jgi:hypothetical protein
MHPAVRTLLFAALIGSAPSAKADGTITSCSHLEERSFSPPGGIGKPGWHESETKKDYEIKLSITNGAWDIIRVNKSVKFSALSMGCHVGMNFDKDEPLHTVYVVSCPTFIETLLFYHRDGEPRLILTRLFHKPGQEAIIVEVAGSCRTGD